LTFESRASLMGDIFSDGTRATQSSLISGALEDFPVAQPVPKATTAATPNAPFFHPFMSPP
jgi:hypothetical protein